MGKEFATDYLVVGAGAMGMAFTDVLLSESDATITIVDSLSLIHISEPTRPY